MSRGDTGEKNQSWPVVTCSSSWRLHLLIFFYSSNTFCKYALGHNLFYHCRIFNILFLFGLTFGVPINVLFCLLHPARYVQVTTDQMCKKNWQRHFPKHTVELKSLLFPIKLWHMTFVKYPLYDTISPVSRKRWLCLAPFDSVCQPGAVRICISITTGLPTLRCVFNWWCACFESMMFKVPS